MSTPYHIQLIRNRLVRIDAIPKPSKTVPIQVSPHQRRETLALYRAAIRETKKIKHDTHLRDWFLDWFRRSFKRNIEVVSEELLRTKLRRASRELRCIRGVNANVLIDLDRALRYAYARVGPTRHEILQRIVRQPMPQTSLPKENKHQNEFPRYPPLLKHLLINGNTTDNPVPPRRLDWPSVLPERADPTSEAAHLLGPLPRRRERNIRWKFYRDILSSVRVPLGLVDGPYKVMGIAPDAIKRLERLASGVGDDGSTLDRSVRRAYGRILGVTPIMQQRVGRSADSHAGYSSKLSPLAVRQSGRFVNVGTRPMEPMPSRAEEWLRKAIPPPTRGGGQQQNRKGPTAPKPKILKQMIKRIFLGNEEGRELSRLFSPELDWDTLRRASWRATKQAESTT